MPARDKDLGTHSKPIEVYGNISMGLGPELFREMNREIINGFGRETNPEVAEVDGTAVKKKSDLAGRRGPGQLEMKIGVGSAGVWQMTRKC